MQNSLAEKEEDFEIVETDEGQVEETEQEPQDESPMTKANNSIYLILWCVVIIFKLINRRL